MKIAYFCERGISTNTMTRRGSQAICSSATTSSSTILMFATRKKVFMLVSWEENLHRDLFGGRNFPPLLTITGKKKKKKKKKMNGIFTPFLQFFFLLFFLADPLLDPFQKVANKIPTLLQQFLKGLGLDKHSHLKFDIAC